MPKPLVSVVIPAFNAAEFITEAINSIQSQSYPRIEIIVVDDGSTDETGDTAQRVLSSNGTDFVFLKHEQNLGECRASLTGFHKASGKYICRLSADDFFASQHHIQDQVDEMERTGADWCYNSINSILKDGAVTIAKTFWLPIPTRFFTEWFMAFDNFILRHPYLAYLRINFGNTVNSSSLMIRKSAYGDKVTFPFTFRRDCDGYILMSLLLNKKVGRAIRKIGAVYRIHQNQGTFSEGYITDMKNIRLGFYNYVTHNDYPFWMKLAVRIIKKIKYG